MMVKKMVTCNVCAIVVCKMYCAMTRTSSNLIQFINSANQYTTIHLRHHSSIFSSVKFNYFNFNYSNFNLFPLNRGQKYRLSLNVWNNVRGTGLYTHSRCGPVISPAEVIVVIKSWSMMTSLAPQSEMKTFAWHSMFVVFFLATKKIVNVFFGGQCQHTEKSCSLRGRRYLFCYLCLSKLVSHNQLLFLAVGGSQAGTDLKTITKRLGKS